MSACNGEAACALIKSGGHSNVQRKLYSVKINLRHYILKFIYSCEQQSSAKVYYRRENKVQTELVRGTMHGIFSCLFIKIKLKVGLVLLNPVVHSMCKRT